MSRRWLLSLLCLSLLFLSLVQLTHAGGELKVNETNTRLLFEKNPAEVLLAIENSTGKSLNARVELELLGPQNHSKTSTAQVQAIAPGKKNLTVPLGISYSDFNTEERKQLLWFRLQYRLVDAESNNNLTEGIISLSEITYDLFEIHLVTTDFAREGGRYRARVRAVHPISLRPAANLGLEGELTLNDDGDRTVKLRAAKTTDAEGHAVLEFQLPPRFPQFPHTALSSGGDIKVTAKRGAVISELSTDVLVDQFSKILISTDKPMYQPGQVMHVRALVFSPSKHALANHDVVMRILDPEDTGVHRTVVKSSRFGVVSTDWSIPANTRLGSYRIRVGLDDEEAWSQEYYVRISRYDLPNFTVNVETDRKFYLPGQRAEVKVRADYLFGQPVTKGHVRVVRESNREWNYREQKWDLEEGDKYEGDADAKGAFTARIDLSEDHEDITGEEYSPFEDITYAAYFTDPTTNRTEQRRFDIRVTKDPIHVYVMDRSYYSEHNPDLPLEFDVSTVYADGTPARCEVRLKLIDGWGDEKTRVSKLLPTARTNRYGLARISDARWPRELSDKKKVELVISATDSRRRKGSRTKNVYLDDSKTVVVEADKALYRTGEPINLVLTSTAPGEVLNVDLVRDSVVIRSERVRLHDGRASLTFPYRSDFKDRMTIAAYPDLLNSMSMVGTDTVLYPNNVELKVNMRTSQESYRPGEDAKVDLNVRASQGASAESALGMVVFDKAVEERFRTDLEFGDGMWSFYRSLQSFLGFEGQVAGVTFGDLQRLDMAKPVSPDLDLLADILLRLGTDYYPGFHKADEYDRNSNKYFFSPAQKQIAPLIKALEDRYSRTQEHPNDAESLRRLLRESGIDFDALRDPWGVPYRASFVINGESDLLELTSAGADKRFQTSDDFSVSRLTWLYFRPTGLKIDGAVQRHHQQTGSFIRDLDTLRAEIAKDGLNLDQLRDRWGQPYRVAFTVRDANFLIVISSAGPDKRFAVRSYTEDDFVMWLSSIDYFAEKRAKIESALQKHLESTKQFPQTEQQLRDALPGEDIDGLRDPWGRPYYRTFKTQFHYGDRVRIENRTTFGDATSRLEIVPVTRSLAFVSLRSQGADGIAGTIDDFSVATFSGIISEQQRGEAKPRQVTTDVVFSQGNGVIYGVVTDSPGAIVPNVSVVLKGSVDNVERVTTTNDEGRYTFGNLSPGVYQLRFEAAGFKNSIVNDISVSAASLTEVNITLEAGAVSEAVTVTSESNMLLDGVNASVVNGGRGKVTLVTKSGSAPISTPRLREYFPETLLWQPLIETDKQGRAKINFKLADNITTWKVAVIASTEDGRIGTTEKEIRAFQPFFVEHEPPRVLTEGDEISLPVVVRNYLEKEQNVNLEIKPENWFSLLGPARKRTAVIAGDAKRETFDFRVISSIDDGKQRITAIGSDANDAIEKPVSVHPDGEEVSVTAADIVGSSGLLEMVLPENVIPKSNRAELKIYPNLMGHVIESVEAIMQRPYGCAEQTISSSYPSLLLLAHQKRSGEELAFRPRAERYLKNGYNMVLNYRDEEGGFSYWGRGNGDAALTAYALRFFTEASDVIEVDRKVIEDAREWLVKHQQADGSWESFKYWRAQDQKRRDTLLTAYVSRILAMVEAKLGRDQSFASAEVTTARKRALDYLGKHATEIDEPYLLASFALALIDSQDIKRAKPIIDKLRLLAQAEGDTTYWALETNTPFYGWGVAGRVETTALVLQALNRYCKADGANGESDAKTISRALLFLLKQKDRYGVWYSSQATINVLDALLTIFSTQGNSAPESTAEIVVNDRVVKTIQMPAGNRLVSPITVDLTSSVRTGKNKIEIRRPGGLPFASAQALMNYYVPWPKATATNHVANVSNDLRLTAKFDKTDAKINDTITCHVEAERIGFRGYGMMLAEIGLPPGADVDRSSLETAMKGSGWAIGQYDVLPDRVVVYLWPEAGGIKFDFKFRPRFGLNAKSAPSTIYDYYNPESRATVAPAQFRVR